MSNLDKLITNDPTASEPTNPLEMYVAKINGTYTGDIPEATNDLEKALAWFAESGSGPAAEWPKLKIENNHQSKSLEIYYLDPSAGGFVPLLIVPGESRTIPFPAATVNKEGRENTGLRGMLKLNRGTSEELNYNNLEFNGTNVNDIVNSESPSADIFIIMNRTSGSSFFKIYSTEIVLDVGTIDSSNTLVFYPNTSNYL